MWAFSGKKVVKSKSKKMNKIFKMNEIRKNEQILANERNLTNEWNLKKKEKKISIHSWYFFDNYSFIHNVNMHHKHHIFLVYDILRWSYHKTPEKTRCENNHVDQDEKPSWFWWCKSFHFIKIHQRPLKWENEWKWMKIMANYVALFD